MGVLVERANYCVKKRTNLCTRLNWQFGNVRDSSAVDRCSRDSWRAQVRIIAQYMDFDVKTMTLWQPSRTRFPRTMACDRSRYGRGAGVGRSLGVGLGRTVGVGVGVAVDVAVGVGDGVGVTLGVTVGVGVGVTGVGVALGVGVGVPCVQGVALDTGVGETLGVGGGVPTAAAISMRPQP